MMLVDELCNLVTGRGSDLFSEDLEAKRSLVRDSIEGRRVLVVGAAGSIGASTVQALLPFRPAALHLVDQSENSLVELVRDLRSRGVVVPADFRSLPLDFGGPVMRQFLLENAEYDHVLNFAALKHVRSEKDAFSTIQLLDTNIVKAARLLRSLAERGFRGRYFAVSTDKAANPVNLMGASKRAMEHVMFSGEIADGFGVTSARFANVAYSDGSLLQGFLRRIEKRQPLAVPVDTRRYFISLREAGQICLLAAACSPTRHLLIPRLDATTDLIDLEITATRTLHAHGFAPAFFDREQDARAAIATEVAAGRYPVLRTPLDTSGEKAFEEFVGAGESSVELGLPNLLAVRHAPAPPGAVSRSVEYVQTVVEGRVPHVRKEDLVACIAGLVPELRHAETGRTLDDRM